MARNIEIKAHIDSVETLLPKVMVLASSEAVEIAQDDTFFPCANGRLKLRTFSPTQGELIFYSRSDQAGPKTSFYLISSTSQPEQLREVLTAAHGVIGRVRKRRILLLVGRTRVHIDSVDNLGTFLELEVVLAEGEDESHGMAEAHVLMQTLGVLPTQLIEGAYLDLLQGH